MILLWALCEKIYLIITKTGIYNFDPLKPHFYIAKLRFKGVYIIFSYFAKKKKKYRFEKT